MKAAILHSIASLKLHGLVCITVAKSANCSPGARVRLQDLSERYNRMAAHIEGRTDKTGVAIDDLTGNPSDLPAFDDLSKMVDWGPYMGDGHITWGLYLANDKLEPIPNTKVSGVTLWDFYNAVKKSYPDAPRGLIGWATYARKGDAAAFYQNKTNLIYYVSLE